MAKRMTKEALIKSLDTDKASNVLWALLNENPALEDTVYKIAMQVLCDVNSDGIMNDVYYGLNSIDVDALSARSGRTRYGYTDPADASWEMFEEELEPFIDEMIKYQKRGMPSVAKEYCIGIIKGLRKYEKESTSDFSDWVPDAPGEFIESVYEEWKKGQPSEDDIVEVIEIKDE